MYRDFRKNESRFQNKEYKKEGQNPGKFPGEKEDVKIQEILTNIESLAKLKDLNIKSFSDEGGYADQLALKLKGMKTTQLRKFFAEIKIIEKRLDGRETWKNIEAEFYRLKPMLAFANGRKDSYGKKLVPDVFYHIVKTGLAKVDIGTDEEKKSNLKMLARFLEAVVAYHKFHGGK